MTFSAVEWREYYRFLRDISLQLICLCVELVLRKNIRIFIPIIPSTIIICKLGANYSLLSLGEECKCVVNILHPAVLKNLLHRVPLERVWLQYFAQ